MSAVSLIKRLLSLLGWSLVALGVWVGWTLAHHPKLEAFKVLNIVGLSLDLLGVVVLSELVAQSDRVKKFIVNRVALAVMQIQFLVPLGAMHGALFSFGAPSWATATSLFLSVWAWSWLPFVVLERLVVWPAFAALQDVTQRSRAFGLVLLLGGGTIQMVAAFMDLRA